MPKTKEKESVLHDWLEGLTFQMQALLMTGIRGADATSKHNTGKYLTRYLRGVVLKPAGDWNGTNNNSFMWGNYAKFADYAIEFLNDHDEYPHHWIMHLIHCAQVIGYKHPDDLTRQKWFSFYAAACDCFHMHCETETEMDKRLNDFKNGE